MIDVVGKRNLWYLISAIAIIPGFISLVVYGINWGIDFTGGTSWELEFQQPMTTAQVREVLSRNGFGDAVIQTTGDENQTVIIRMEEIQEGSGDKELIENDLRSTFGEFRELQFTSIGPSVGEAIRDRAVISVLIASVGILIYIAWAFRNTNNPLLYGACAIAALLHDAFFVLGIFSILGWVADVEVDALFVTAMLTIIGFSVHDSIVVFDRIRENLARRIAPTFEETVNYSVVQTMVRSLNTSLTVMLTLLALYLFGGESIRWFVFALLIGVAAGTYSSIFNASQLLVSWEKGEIQRWFTFWRRGSGSPRTRAAS